jgi:hypothetical protein
VRLKLERRDDAEVAARAADRPEEILVLGRARTAELAVRGDDVDREEAVDREPVLAAQMSHAAVQRQAGDARRRDDAPGHREAEQLRLAVRVAPRGARLVLSPACVDGSTWTPRMRDRSMTMPAVVHGVAGDVVAAALDRQRQPVLAGEVHRVDDVRARRRLHDERGPAIDEPVPDRARVVVAVVAWAEDGTTNAAANPGLLPDRVSSQSSPLLTPFPRCGRAVWSPQERKRYDFTDAI